MEWKEYSLGDICSRLSSGKNIKASEVHNDGLYPVFGGNGIRGFTNKQNFNGKCAVIGRQGAYCGNVRYFNGVAYMTEHALVLQGNEKSETQFLAYLLSIMDLGRLSGQSAQPGLSVKTLKIQKVRIPVNLSDQRRIAGILSALDSKIENNNKINANLEAQAQALFKSWFVDFTPFKDQPFVDSELGPIPQGWKVGKLGDICTFKRGKNLLSKNAIDEGVPVVAGGLTPSCYHNQANTSAPVVTVSGSGANAGFMRMYHVDVWASDCSFIDVSCDYLYFVYCFLSVNRRLLKHAQTGAVQPHVKPADIHDFDVVIPEEDIVKAFQSIIKELLTKVGVNEKENQRLAALRDTLLPKLMSGEIKI